MNREERISVGMTLKITMIQSGASKPEVRRCLYGGSSCEDAEPTSTVVIDSLGLDSLAYAAALAALEKKFGVVLARDLEDIRSMTFQQLCDCIDTLRPPD